MIFRVIIFAAVATLGKSQFSDFTIGRTNHLHLTQGEVLQYNKNITNIGTIFSAPGVFQCRIPGLYAFHFYSLSHIDGKIWLEIYKNSDYIASIFAYTQGDHADAGNSVMLQLVENDRVYVKAHDNYDNTLYGLMDQIYTTFTGVLISPDGMERSNPSVAFCVGLSGHQHPRNGELISYNDVITNLTGSQLALGKFVAPTAGLYIFHYHSLTQLDKTVWLELCHNDNYVNSAFAHTTNGYADAGNTAILHLNIGDYVYIKGRNGKVLDIFGSPDQVYSTFSGALISARFRERRAFSYDDIAFSAGLSHHHSGNQMVFDRIFTNLGNGFNQNNGVFTASVSGVYVFHFHALSLSAHNIWVELFHNYIYIDSLYGHSSSEFASGSNSAVLKLMTGDTVYLKIRSTSSSFYGAGDQIYSTFSGYFLGPIFDEHPIVG